MDIKKLQTYFFIGLFLVVLVFAVLIFLPFLAPIALAFMTAIIVRPVDKWLVKACRGRRPLAAVLSVIFVLVVVLVPLTILVQQITVQSYALFIDLRDGGQGKIDVAASYLLHPIQAIYPSFNPDVNGFVHAVSAYLVSNISNIFSSTTSIGVGIILWIISFFYMLLDGERFKKAIIELSPLADRYDRQIIDRLEKTVNSVVRGTFFVSVIHAFLIGFGFYIFGIPNAILWGAVAAVASFLPAIGMTLMIVPGLAYLLLVGSPGAAIGLAIWGFAIVGLVDNFMLPSLMGRGLTIHPVFVLFSILGGVLFFGPVGVFLGPLVIALLFALIEIYKLMIAADQGAEGPSI